MQKITLFVLCLIMIPMVLYLFTTDKKKQVLSAKTTQTVPTQFIPPTEIPQKDPKIAAAIDTVLKKRNGEYGIYYKDLVTGDVYEKNAHEIFYSASLYKLWVMGELFHQIDEGILKKEQMLDKTVPQLNMEFGIASEDAEMTDGDIAFTVDDALENMITVSSNYAAYLLADRLGTKNIASFLQSNGFADSSFGSPPKTSPHDIGIYFDRLYHRQLVAPIYTKEMIAILSRQQLNDRLPKYLPASIEIAHKTGELYGYKHDAGIIFDPDGAYILVVLSKSNDESYAAETIAQLSKEIYNTRNDL